MPGVLAEASGRQDVLIRRGVTTQWTIRWEQSPDGVNFQPVDLGGCEGVLQLRSPIGDLWLEKPVAGTADGHVIVTITPDDLTGPAWQGRAGGDWLVNLTVPAGRVERLADGHFYLEG